MGPRVVPLLGGRAVVAVVLAETGRASYLRLSRHVRVVKEDCRKQPEERSAAEEKGERTQEQNKIEKVAGPFTARRRAQTQRRGRCE